jgi:hypothetical protein
MASVYYLELADYINEHHVLHVDSIYDRHFLPFERADLTASVLLRPICGGQPPTRPNQPYFMGRRLTPTRPTTAAISTRE